MEAQLPSLFEVSIPFETSHLFFPRIITYITLGLLCLIILVKAKQIVPSLKVAGREVFSREGGIDNKLLFGSLALMIVYFYAMPFVGDYFPNVGLGFLICSVPFLFVMSLIYVAEKSKRVMMIITVNSLVAPLVAWFVLAKLFNITLP